MPYIYIYSYKVNYKIHLKYQAYMECSTIGIDS